MPGGTVTTLNLPTTGESGSTWPGKINAALTTTIGVADRADGARRFAANIVDDYGAPTNTTSDATAAIQSAIDAVGAAFIAGSMNGRNVVTIPAGRYKLTDTITQPPYVKVVALGSVVFETYCTAKPAWWITPLSTDPTSLYAPLLKQQWSAGMLLGGGGGAFNFINRTGTPGTTGCLEVGPRADLTSDRPMARYEIGNVTIQNYGVALQINAINHYIGTYRNVYMERNTSTVVIGTGVANVNSGERMAFENCTFAAPYYDTAQQPALIFNCDSFDVTCYNCSFDFIGGVARWKNFAQAALRIVGGHIEAINQDVRYLTTGGMFVSEVADGASTGYPKVVMEGLIPLVSKQRGLHFQGNMAVYFDGTWRFNDSSANEDRSAANNFLGDDKALFRRVNFPYAGQMPAVSRALNYLRDPVLAAESNGTSTAGLTNWVNVSNGSGMSAVVSADGPRASGSKSIIFTATTAGAGYLKVAPKTYNTCEPGDEIQSTVAFKVTGSTVPVITVGMGFYDSEKVLIGSVATAAPALGATTPGAWMVPITSVRFNAPPGAAFCRPEFTVTNADTTVPATYYLSEFHVYKANM